MPVMRRDDLVLFIGLAAAVLVIFSEQIAAGLSVVREFEAARRIQFLPATIIAVTLFAAHLVSKGREARAAARHAEQAARRADERAGGLARLVDFGKALADATDLESIRVVAGHHLPLLVPGRTLWVMTRTRGHWDALVTLGGELGEQCERSARRAIGEGDAETGGETDVSFPLAHGGAVVGVLGVGAQSGLSGDERAALSAAASMLAVSLRNAELLREVRENSVRDTLTGCFTRAHALEVLEVELRRARRTQMPLSILMIDLDDFARVNERYGRLCGDAVLAVVGQRLKRTLRGSDVKCRYGGEEFLVILTDTPIGGAMKVSETLTREIAADHVMWDGERVSVTASVGVATVRAGEVDPSAALARAQDALVRARRDDRHRPCDDEYVAVPA